MTDAERLELEHYRRHDLLQRMRAISEHHWASSWQSGLEHDLYLMAFEGTRAEYGMGPIADAELAQLKRLAELTNVWWTWSDTHSQPLAIALDEAEKRYAQLSAEDAHGGELRMSVAEAKQRYARAAASDWDAETIAPMLSGMPAWHVLRLRSYPVIALYFREEERDWELRFGATTIDCVSPAWAAGLAP